MDAPIDNDVHCCMGEAVIKLYNIIITFQKSCMYQHSPAGM